MFVIVCVLCAPVARWYVRACMRVRVANYSCCESVVVVVAWSGWFQLLSSLLLVACVFTLFAVMVALVTMCHISVPCRCARVRARCMGVLVVVVVALLYVAIKLWIWFCRVLCIAVVGCCVAIVIVRSLCALWFCWLARGVVCALPWRRWFAHIDWSVGLSGVAVSWFVVCRCAVVLCHVGAWAHWCVGVVVVVVVFRVSGGGGCVGALVCWFGACLVWCALALDVLVWLGVVLVCIGLLACVFGSAFECACASCCCVCAIARWVVSVFVSLCVVLCLCVVCIGARSLCVRSVFCVCGRERVVVRFCVC